MEFSIKNGNPEKQRKDCVIVGVFESRKLTDAAVMIDKASTGYLTAILRHGDMEGKLASSLLLHSVPGTLGERVLLVGLGKEHEFRESKYRQVVRASVNALSKSGATDVVSFLAELPVKKRDIAWKVAHLAEVAMDSAYRFDQMKGKASKAKITDGKDIKVGDIVRQKE